MTLENTLITVAQEAGAFIAKHALRPDLGVEMKNAQGERDDPVTLLDRQAEQLIKARLREDTALARTYGTLNFCGEEYGTENNGGALNFYIDPIDGTKSFVRRQFNSAVSIGVDLEGELIAGVVYDFMRGIMYVGSTKDAYLLHEGTRYAFPQTNGLTKYDIMVEGDRVPKQVKRYLGMQEDVTLRKSCGSIALHLCDLAKTTYTGMIEDSGKGATYDIAGGFAVLQGAGFTTRNRYGEPIDHLHIDEGLMILRPDLEERMLAHLAILR